MKLIKMTQRPNLEAPLLSVTTVGLRLAQFVTRQESLVVDLNVPIADNHDFEDPTFMVTCWKAKAAVQIAVSTSFSWPAAVQRQESLDHLQ